MKTVVLRFPRSTSRRFAVPCLLLALGCLLAATPGSLFAQFFQADDFNDGNDTGWQRYNPFAAAGAPNLVQWSFVGGGYRIRTTAPTPMLDPLGPGRGGSLRPEVYTNFYISVDIVNWNDALPHAAGILARVRTPGLGTTTGYAFTWDRGNPASATAGDVDFSRITGEVPTGITLTGSDGIHLQPGKSYRFVFIGRGPNLEGRVYELPDTTTPKIRVTGYDETYQDGLGGLVIYDNSTGATNVCDITFDNYYATDIEPPRLTMTQQTFGDYEVAWPAEASSYVLQSSTELVEASWMDVPSSEIISFADRFAYFFNPQLDGPPIRFFRLIRRPEGGN